MKQAQDLQKKMAEAQKKVESLEAEGTSGGGLIKIIIDGKNNVKSVKIDESLISKDDIEILEDLILAAFNDGKEKIQKKTYGSLLQTLPVQTKIASAVCKQNRKHAILLLLDPQTLPPLNLTKRNSGTKSSFGIFPVPIHKLCLNCVNYLDVTAEHAGNLNVALKCGANN